MAKHKSKLKKKKISKRISWKSLLRQHKIVAVLSLILIFVLFNTVAHPRYKDWDNAQLIKGLAHDFPLLVEDIEQATGLDLEIKSNCSTTTEKFSSGVKTCEISIAKKQDQSKIDAAINAMKNSGFSDNYESVNGLGYKIKYRNKNSCQMNSKNSIYINCLTAVRDANTELAIEEFSKIE